MDYRGTTALVTGASSGVGAQFATDLAARGANLVLVARRKDRLDDLAQRLEADHSITVTTIAADLSQPNTAAAIRSELQDRGVTISMLVNNAGLASTGPLLHATEQAVHDQIAVNIAALVDLTHAFLPDLVASGNGVLVNVSSMAGAQPIPGLAAYSASKTFVRNFTSAIAYELRDEPVKVLTLVPGATKTEFWTAAGMTETGTSFETPEDVVATALNALDRNDVPTTAVSGSRNRLMFRLIGLLPVPERTTLRLAAGMNARGGASRTEATPARG